MTFERITAAVFLAVSALGIAAATAHAEPAVAEQPTAVPTGRTVSGVDRGIGYRITVSPADRVVVATVENGRFVAHNGEALLESDTGTAVTEVPRWFAIGGRSIALGQHIGADGRTLTLTPTAGDGTQPKDIGSYERLREQIDKNMPGVVAGAIVGGLLGACLFLIWGVSIPAGALIGGTIGGYLMGGPEFLDAVQAFVTGQP